MEESINIQPADQPEYQTPAALTAIALAQPKANLIRELLSFGASYEEGEQLALTGILERERVRRAIDPESEGGHLDIDWTKTNAWIESLQGDLARAMYPVVVERVRDLEKSIVAILKTAEEGA